MSKQVERHMYSESYLLDSLAVRLGGRAAELLTGNRAALDSLVSLLLEMEAVDGAEVYRIAGRPDRSAIVPPVPPITDAAPRRAAAARTEPAAAEAETVVVTPSG